MTAPDPAVRSIRIATTLNERFRDAAAEQLYDDLCDQQIQGMRAQLDADPCDGTKLDELIATMRMTTPRTARETAATYRDLCARSKATPSEPQ